MNNQTRKLSEGAMMVALVGVMLLLNRQFANMIEYAMYWILTFPTLIYTAKYGIKYGILTSCCMLLVSIMIAAPTTIFYLFCCIVVGVSYGEGVRRDASNARLLIVTGSMTLLSYIITTIVFAGLFGYKPQDDVEIMQVILQMMHIDVPALSAKALLPMIVLLVSVVMSVLQTICIHMLAKLLLKRLKIKTREMKSIFDLHVHKYFGFIIIIIWVLFFARNVLKLNQEVSMIVIGLFLCSFVFALGYGALTCMVLCLVRKRRGAIFLVMIATLLPYVQSLIAVIGIMDMLCSIRKHMKRGVIHGQT